MADTARAVAAGTQFVVADALLGDRVAVGFTHPTIDDARSCARLFNRSSTERLKNTHRSMANLPINVGLCCAAACIGPGHAGPLERTLSDDNMPTAST